MGHQKRSFALFPIFILCLCTSTARAQSTENVQVTPDEVRTLRELLIQQQRELEVLKREVESLRTEVLRRNGILTRPSSTAATPVASQPPTSPAPPRTERPLNTFRFNGLMQVWGIAGNSGYNDTFRVRRTELKFSGDISAHVRWLVMLDPAKALSLNVGTTTFDGTPVVSGASVNQASRILQDAVISVDKVPHLRIDVGQFKIPLSLEGSESSAALLTPERTLFMSDRARGGTYGDIRDVGVMITTNIGKRLVLYLGEFNGVGDRQNDLALNDQKATIGRAVFKPRPWVHFGVSGAYGNGNSAAGRPRRDRLGTEFMLAHAGFILKSEWMQGKDGDITRQGYYAVASYRPPSGRLANFEPVIRFDTFDPDLSHVAMNSATVPERDYIAGVNWYVQDSRVRLQFHYAKKTFTNDVVPELHTLVLTMQTAW